VPVWESEVGDGRFGDGIDLGQFESATLQFLGCEVRVAERCVGGGLVLGGELWALFGEPSCCGWSWRSLGCDCLC